MHVPHTIYYVLISFVMKACGSWTELWALDDILIWKTFDLEMFQKCVEQLFNSFQWKTFDMLAHTHMHTLLHTNLHEHVNDGKFMVDDVEIWCKQDLHTVIFVLLHEFNWDATSEATTAAVVAVMIAPLPNFFLASLFMWCVFFYFLYHFSESYKMFHNAEII